MTADPVPPAARPPSGDRLSRVLRLAHKELRETLRDRRTIFTLVLMPLLVYPVLGLAFKQFLLSSFRRPSDVQWIVGTATQEQALTLSLRINEGDRLLRGRGPAGSKPDTDDRTPDKQLAIMIDDQNDLPTLVRQLEIDLAVRVRPRGYNPAAGPAKFVEFDLIYRPNVPISRQAAEYVERRLRAVNDEYVRRRLQSLSGTSELPSTWRLDPIAEEEGQSFWLASLVPLILILMTITGAVYPAIDLTAGERERGTLEALMAAPVPRLSLLFAKYIAVVTVAMLTAVVNIIGMMVTVLSTGLAPVLFGEQGLSLDSIVIVFLLLLLFAAFFSAVLLCVTSFARSFKEAQAYLIPLMLVSMAPGFLSVMPGLSLNAWLAVAPLANIVLLARDVMAHEAHPLWGLVAVVTTALYGTAALGLAARIFGSDAILYGSQGQWEDLWRRPNVLRATPTPSGAMTALAILVPLFVITSGLLSQMRGFPMAVQLMASSGLLLLLFLVLPLAMARWQGVAVRSGFQLTMPPALSVVGAIVLGVSLWPLAYELIIASREWGLATITDQQLANFKLTVDDLLVQWRSLPLVAILVALAIVPAVAEEWFFRGYFLGALRGTLPAWLAILFAGLIFGLFHASLGGVVMLERVVSSTFLGLILGWVCWTSRSIFPGMILHALNNGILLTMAYWNDHLKGLVVDVSGQRHFPAVWLLAAGAGVVIGLVLVTLSRRAMPRSHGSG